MILVIAFLAPLAAGFTHEADAPGARLRDLPRRHRGPERARPGEDHRPDQPAVGPRAVGAHLPRRLRARPPARPGPAARARHHRLAAVGRARHRGRASCCRRSASSRPSCTSASRSRRPRSARCCRSSATPGCCPTRFGTHVLAIGSLGEFGPIIAIAVVLSGASAGAGRAVAAGVRRGRDRRRCCSRRGSTRRGSRRCSGSTLRSSGQLYIRLAVVLIAVMAFVADELGLDFLLGAFTAGVLYRIFLLAGADAREREMVESKLEAVTFGYLIPIFFVVTGVRFDLELARVADRAPQDPALPRAVPRGPRPADPAVPHGDPRRPGAARRSRCSAPPGCRSWSRSPRSASPPGRCARRPRPALVAAAMLSVVIYPMIGMRLAPRATPVGHPGGGRGARVTRTRTSRAPSARSTATRRSAAARSPTLADRVRHAAPGARHRRRRRPCRGVRRRARRARPPGARRVRHQGAARSSRWCGASAAHGIGADVTTAGELAVATAAGVPMRAVVHHGNARSRAELAEAAAAGVGLVVLDGPQDVEHLDAVATGPVDVLVRITPGVPPATHASMATAHHGQKFGVTIAEAPGAVPRPSTRRGTCGCGASTSTSARRSPRSSPFVDAVQRVRRTRVVRGARRGRRARRAARRRAWTVPDTAAYVHGARRRDARRRVRARHRAHRRAGPVARRRARWSRCTGCAR